MKIKAMRRNSFFFNYGFRVHKLQPLDKRKKSALEEVAFPVELESYHYSVKQYAIL